MKLYVEIWSHLQQRDLKFFSHYSQCINVPVKKDLLHTPSEKRICEENINNIQYYNPFNNLIQPREKQEKITVLTNYMYMYIQNKNNNKNQS